MRARAFRRGATTVVLFDAATTQSKALRAEALKAFKRDLKDQGPSYDSFHVCIWIEGYRRGRRLDVDNVAKASLDALVGLVWRDDRQVTRLCVEKLTAGPDQVVVAATPTALGEESEALASLLQDLA